MKKTYKELDDFYFEPSLRRERKGNVVVHALFFAGEILLVAIALVLLYNLVMGTLTARAQSVLLSDQSKIESIMSQCEDKVRELSV
jgi:hypothetical protein